MSTEIVEKARGIYSKLTPLQVQFVKHVVEDGLGNNAALRAMGLDPKSRTRDFSQNPKVQAALIKHREEYARSAGIKKADVITAMKEAADMAKTLADPMGMVAGWREIGKLCGFYEPVRRELTISVTGQKNLTRLQSMSDQDLLEMIEQGEEIVEGEFSAVAEDEEIGTEDGDSDVDG